MSLISADMLVNPAYKDMVDAYFRKIIQGVPKMSQRLFTIEIKVDFKDEEKFPLFVKIVQQAARQMYGQGAMLNDGVKPEMAIYGHDYFKGHADIALFDDDIESGKKAITEAGNILPEPALTNGAVAETKPTPIAPPENAQSFDPALLAALK